VPLYMLPHADGIVMMIVLNVLLLNFF